jgi:hypothetical protein
LHSAKAKKAARLEAERLAAAAAQAAKDKADAEEIEKAKVANVKREDGLVTDVAETRKPGRPPGAKNKPKSPAMGEGPPPVDERPLEARVRSVTITRGGTVNMGNFQSARFEVSMSIDVAEDADEAIAYLDQKVQNMALEELGKFARAAQAETKK